MPGCCGIGRAVVTLGLVLTPAVHARAQSTTDTVYHLHGSVVNGVTGRPIGRALVISQDRRLATMTNTEGQFTLDVSVPPAAAASAVQSAPSGGLGGTSPGMFGSGVRLTAQRPGFLQSRQIATVSLDASADTRSILLRLMPSSSVRGVVTASGTEGMRGVRVQLLRRTVQDGRYSWRMVNTRPVAADGSFQMTDLSPGEYTVVTGAWSPRDFIVTATPTLTNQYPPVFLGGTRTLDGATKLHLGYGQSAQASIRLSVVPYYPVIIPVQGITEDTNATVRVAAGAGFQLYNLGWDARDFKIQGSLPDGDYTVVVNTAVPQRAGVVIPVHVAGAPILHAPVGLVPMRQIPISVRDERTRTNTGAASGSGTAPAYAGFYLFARPEDAEAGGGGMMQNSADGPMLLGMMPGRYHLQANATGQGYIAALTCDGVNLLTEPLVVSDAGRTAPIEVTLRDDGGTVAGTVNLGSSGLSTVNVLLLPTDGSGHAFYAYVAAGTGRFQLSNVPPGSYRALAMPADGGETLPYRDTQAMRAFDGKGSAVSVSAGQTSQVEAELIAVDGTGVQP